MAVKEEKAKSGISFKNGVESNALEVILPEDAEVYPTYETMEGRLKEIFNSVSLNCCSDHGIPASILENHDENTLKMVAGSHYIPKKRFGMLSGQDAHFVHYDDKGRTTIGVADGVGGWLEVRIDSGIYARELMKNAVISMHQNPSLTGILLLKRILHDAWLNTKAKGASTACFLTLSDGNILCATNVGDSGFMVIREENGGKTTVYKSGVQTINNAPCQLGRASHTGTTPEDAQDTIFRVKDGDIVVLATDGLLDNVFPHEIVRIIATCRSINGGVLPPAALVAGVIAKVALLLSVGKDTIRPWTKEARHGYGAEHPGGKPDDITVVVGYIGNHAFMKGLSQLSK